MENPTFLDVVDVQALAYQGRWTASVYPTPQTETRPRWSFTEYIYRHVYITPSHSYIYLLITLIHYLP